MTKKMCIFAVSLMWCIQFSVALYFHIGETERKCFIEEIPDETTVLGKLFTFRMNCANLVKTLDFELLILSAIILNMLYPL